MPVKNWPSDSVVPDSEEERIRERTKVPTGEVIVLSDSEETDVFNPKGKVNLLNKKYKAATRPTQRQGRKIIHDSEDSEEVEFVEPSPKKVPRLPPLKEPLPQPSLGLPPIRTNSDEGIHYLFEHPKMPLKAAPSKKKPEPVQSKAKATPKPKETPARASSSTAAGSKEPKTPTKRVPRTPAKLSEKKLKQIELERRKDYAQTIFSTVNEKVFRSRLPTTTELVWNNRLTTTAGRAKYHRARDGVKTLSIELAEKILDCDERIRNTLCHEMCHLATWVIDEQVSEHHGPNFKRWALLVERKFPNIEVSIKHDYQINHKYNWKCQKCGKTYGRFSKSIKPEECLCGACKEGRLEPLFEQKPRKTQVQRSRLAAATPQGSPISTPVRQQSRDSEQEVECLLDSGSEASYEDDDDDDDIQFIANSLAATQISDI